MTDFDMEHLAETILDIIERPLAAQAKRIDALEKALAEERSKPKGMQYRGVHQRALAYAQGDAVTHAGGLWVALKDIEPGEKPGTSEKWILAAKGGER